jgi:hypothetical protein
MLSSQHRNEILSRVSQELVLLHVHRRESLEHIG